MEEHQISIEYISVKYRRCDSCGYCKQTEDHEFSDSDIEQYVEKKLLAEK